MVAEGMEVEKVDHGAEAQPVDRVADGAGQDQPQAERGTGRVSR